MFLELRQITFGYDSSLQPVFADVSLCFASGWTGIVGANGSGKTTLLRLACGELSPDGGRVLTRGSIVYCPQRTDSPPATLADLLAATSGFCCQLRRRLGVEPDFVDRWDSLSHGERKRAQIATALMSRPDILALDEPTNHIDAQARELLLAALLELAGIGLVVSHDRYLLDTLCTACVLVEPPRASIVVGGYTRASELTRRQEQHQAKQRELAQREQERLERQVSSRRHEAARADKVRSARHIDRHDKDARGRINLARCTGKDGQAGRLTRQLQGRLRQAQEHVDTLRTKKTYATGVWLPNSCSQRDALLRLPAGRLPLGGERNLVTPQLWIGPTSRIAVTGANGSGKSTLIRYLVQHLSAPPDKLVYLPQEIMADSARQILQEVRSLDDASLGQVMTVVSRLGSRPQRLLETLDPSPGEIRKILLALGIARAPHLIVMDEPTNHLDLPAIECLETALAACPCALVLVSHDVVFLSRLTTSTWHLEGDELRVTA